MKDHFIKEICAASLMVFSLGASAQTSEAPRENTPPAVAPGVVTQPGVNPVIPSIATTDDEPVRPINTPPGVNPPVPSRATLELSKRIKRINLPPHGNSETPPEVKALRGGMTGTTLIPDESARLLNVDFAAWGDVEVGLAAIGHTTNDVWNAYAAPWAPQGELAHTVWSDGSPSPARIAVENAPGQWGSSVNDPMYRSYIYPHDGGAITVTISNLPPALYDLYLYGHGGPSVDRPLQPEDNQQNSVFRVSTPANGAHYGEAATTTTAAWRDPVWKEGSQYVVFRKVAVVEGPIEITVERGGSTYAIISGLQIVEAGKLSGLRDDFSSVLSTAKSTRTRPAKTPSAPLLRSRSPARSVSDELGAGMLEEEGNRAFEQAIRAYQLAVSEYDRQRPSAANAIFRLGECYRKLGRFDEAKVQYARILREFADQKELAAYSRKFMAVPDSPATPPAPREEQ